MFAFSQSNVNLISSIAYPNIKLKVQFFLRCYRRDQNINSGWSIQVESFCNWHSSQAPSPFIPSRNSWYHDVSGILVTSKTKFTGKCTNRSKTISEGNLCCKSCAEPHWKYSKNQMLIWCGIIRKLNLVPDFSGGLWWRKLHRNYILLLVFVRTILFGGISHWRIVCRGNGQTENRDSFPGQVYMWNGGLSLPPSIHQLTIKSFRAEHCRMLNQIIRVYL